MATSSFLNNITIRKKKEAESFLNALEKAENKKSKIVKYTARVEDIKDEETIRKILIFSQSTKGFRSKNIDQQLIKSIDFADLIIGFDTFYVTFQ